MSLTEVLEEVTKLKPSEKRKVLDTLLRDKQIAEIEKSSEEKRAELYLRLETEGSLRVPSNYGKPSVPRDFEPVPIKGKPLSETIIEERR